MPRRFTFFISGEIVKSRQRIRCVLCYPGFSEAAAVAPSFVPAASHHEHRLVAADVIQQFFPRTMLVKHPFSISESEICLIVGMLVHVSPDLSQTFLERPLYIEHYP